MPDNEESRIAISMAELERLMTSLRNAFIETGLPSDGSDEFFDAAADLYVVGYRDGIRHAVSQIAPEAEAHGLRLLLAPELAEPPADK